jgi:hypothetical protein
LAKSLEDLNPSEYNMTSAIRAETEHQKEIILSLTTYAFTARQNTHSRMMNWKLAIL